MTKHLGTWIERFGRPMRRFTPEEDAILKDLWRQYVPHAEIAAAIDRSVGTLRQRALKLKLRRNQNLSYALNQYAPEHLKDKIGTIPDHQLLYECRAWKKEKERREREEAERLASDGKARVLAAINQTIADHGLSRREKILRLRSLGLTLRAIGDLFDITHERTRQILLMEREAGPIGRPRGSSAPGQTRTPDPLGRLLKMWDVTPPEVRVEFLRRASKGALP